MGWYNFGHQEHMLQFEKIVRQGRLGQAYLFAGPAGVGKFNFAFQLARLLYCAEEKVQSGNEQCGCASCTRMNNVNFPDLQIVLPLPSAVASLAEKKQIQEFNEQVIALIKQKVAAPFNLASAAKRTYISIGMVRRLVPEANKAPLEGKRKIVIMVGADKMTGEAANAFLRVLEEPLPSTTFILTCENTSTLLPTLISRCQIIHFQRLNNEQLLETLSKEQRQHPELLLLAGIAQGSAGNLIDLLENNELQQYRAHALTLLENVCDGSLGELLVFSELFSDKSDLDGIRQTLFFALLLYYDMLSLLVFDEIGRIKNSDMQKSLFSLQEKYTLSQTIHSIYLVEHAMQMLAKSINPQLCLLHLLIHLSKALRRPTYG